MPLPMLSSHSQDAQQEHPALEPKGAVEPLFPGLDWASFWKADLD